MNASWLYHQNPLFIILTLLLAMTTAAEVGFRLGRRWHARSGDAGWTHFRSILGSLLGLLALLLSFTFAMSANRFDSRRQLVLADANALETLYLQSDLLPDASRKAFKQSLRQYVDLRSQIALLPDRLLKLDPDTEQERYPVTISDALKALIEKVRGQTMKART